MLLFCEAGVIAAWVSHVIVTVPVLVPGAEIDAAISVPALALAVPVPLVVQ